MYSAHAIVDFWDDQQTLHTEAVPDFWVENGGKSLRWPLKCKDPRNFIKLRKESTDVWTTYEIKQVRKFYGMYKISVGVLVYLHDKYMNVTNFQYNSLICLQQQKAKEMSRVGTLVEKGT